MSVDSICVGDILKAEFTEEDGLHLKDGATSRTKYFVVAGIDEEYIECVDVLINSQINEMKFWKIGPYQHLITSEDYSFLHHDSYIDGYRPLIMSVEDIKNRSEICGHLKDNDLTEVLQHLSDSPVIPNYIKIKFKLKSS